MKRLIGLSFTLLAMCFAQQTLIGQTTAQKQPASKAGIIKDGAAVKFYNENGNVIKSISLKAKKKYFKGNKNGIISSNTDYYSGVINNKYFELQTVTFYRIDENYSGPGTQGQFHKIEYYNLKGDLLWKVDNAYYSDVSNDGSRVAVVVPIFSEEAKEGQFEDPKSEDPKYKEYIEVIDTMGKEMYRYELKHQNGFGFATTNAKYLWVHEMEERELDMKMKIVYLSIETGKKYIVPEKYGSTYNVILNEKGIITISSRRTKQVERIVKLEEWQ